MEKTIFEILRKHFKTHKEVARQIGLSYTRYNEWRWNPEQIPDYGKKLLELTLEKIDQEPKAPKP